MSEAKFVDIVRRLCAGLLAAGLVLDAIHEALNHRSATVQLGLAWLLLFGNFTRATPKVSSSGEKTGK